MHTFDLITLKGCFLLYLLCHFYPNRARPYFYMETFFIRAGKEIVLFNNLSLIKYKRIMDKNNLTFHRFGLFLDLEGSSH